MGSSLGVGGRDFREPLRRLRALRTSGAAGRLARE